MPTATLTDRPTFVAPLERAFDAQAAAAPASAGGLLAAEPAVVAHRAVDVVMTAVERYTTGDRHSVQLQFSVGGADLSVRVELRGDEVRTTFRTDSPELRSALAHEWQAATAGAHGDADVHLAAPVFSAGNNSNFSSFSGDTSSRQRDAQGRRSEADELFSAVAARSRATPAFSSALDDLGSAAARVKAPATALHLSTHA